MVDETKLTAAYKRVEAMQQDIEVMLGEAGDRLLCKGSNTTIADLVNAYHSFLTQLAEALGDRVDESASEAKALRKSKTEAEKARDAAKAEAKDAKDLKLPEGAMVIGGEKPNELTVMVLRKADRAMLKRVLPAVAKFLAGGTTDIAAVLKEIAQAQKTEFYGEVRGYKGYPQFGTAAVIKSDSEGRLTKSATPEREPDVMSAVGEFLVKAGALGKQVRVDLT